VSGSYVCLFVLFQSSCGANKATAAREMPDNAVCCWAKQRRAEVSEDRRHQLWKRKARNGCCQNPTFNEDIKASTAPCCTHACAYNNPLVNKIGGSMPHKILPAVVSALKLQLSIKTRTGWTTGVRFPVGQ